MQSFLRDYYYTGNHKTNLLSTILKYVLKKIIKFFFQMMLEKNHICMVVFEPEFKSLSKDIFKSVVGHFTYVNKMYSN